MTAITVVETVAIFAAALVTRAALVLAVMAALALPIVAVAATIRWAKELGHRVAEHRVHAHAHR